MQTHVNFEIETERVVDRVMGDVEVYGPGIKFRDSARDAFRLVMSTEDANFFQQHGVCVVCLRVFDTKPSKA